MWLCMDMAKLTKRWRLAQHWPYRRGGREPAVAPLAASHDGAGGAGARAVLWNRARQHHVLTAGRCSLIPD